MKTSSMIISMVLLLTSSLFMSCGTPQRQIAGNYNYETECLGVELDGSQTLRAWGSGRNRSDAVEQAKKNGIRDVMFKGIRAGKSECNVKPLVPEVNAKDKYEDYSNKFFADGGAYSEFITSKEGSDFHTELVKNRQKAGSQETYRVTICVLRAQLKARLIQDNILKQ